MAHDVFISYSTKDKTVADAVCATLEGRGIRCWIAPRDIGFGEWAGAIMKAIEDSRIVVLVFSSHTNDSTDVRREVQAALERGVVVVPLRIEDVKPSDSFGYFLAPLHWLDAMTEPLQDHLNRLAERVQRILEVQAAPGVPSPRKPAAPPVGVSSPPDFLKRWHVARFAAGAVIVALAAAAAFYLFAPQSSTPEKAAAAPPRSLDFIELPGSATYNRAPRYSPDGTRVASQSTATDNSIQIVTSGHDGLNRIPLTRIPGAFVGSPRWSHDGRQVVFDVRTRPGGQADIYVVPSEGGEPTRLTTDPADDVRPSFSNDDTWVYFGSNRSEGRWEIWKVPASGGGTPQQVTLGGGREAVEAPGGDSILYTKFNEQGLWQAGLHGKAQGTRLNSVRGARQGLWDVIPGTSGATAVPPTLILVAPGDGPTRDLEFYTLPALEKDSRRTVTLPVPDLAPSSGKPTEIREVTASPALDEVAYAVSVGEERSLILRVKLP